jgi:hypothetical protein
MAMAQHKDRISYLKRRMETLRDRCVLENREPSLEERREADNAIRETKSLEILIKEENMKNNEQILQYFANRGQNLTAEESAIVRPLVEEMEAAGRDVPSFFYQSQSTPHKPPLGDGRGYSYRNGVFRPSSGPFKTPGEQLMAIMQASIPGGVVDARLPQFRAAATGLQEGIPSEGGFLLQQDFTDALLRRTYEQAPLASMCKRMIIGPNSNGIKVPCIDESSRATGSRLGAFGFIGSARRTNRQVPNLSSVCWNSA